LNRLQNLALKCACFLAKFSFKMCNRLPSLALKCAFFLRKTFLANTNGRFRAKFGKQTCMLKLIFGKHLQHLAKTIAYV